MYVLCRPIRGQNLRYKLNGLQEYRFQDLNISQLHLHLFFLLVFYPLPASLLPREGSYVFVLVFLSVCFSLYLVDKSESCRQILVKIFGDVGCMTSNSWLHVGGGSNYDADSGISTRSLATANRSRVSIRVRFFFCIGPGRSLVIGD